MRFSLLVARLGGAEIRLHWTMLLILPYVYITFRPTTPAETWRGLLLTALVFLSVLLHELGHLLVARLYHQHVSSVVLWALGGAVVSDNEIEDPGAQLFIAAAGPLVNLLIVALLLIGLAAFGLATYLRGGVFELWDVPRDFLFILVTNLILALSNLLPIYPLDGGRIFQAFLHMFTGPVLSIQITSWISTILALGLSAWALAAKDWLMFFTAVLILLGAVSLNQPLILSLVKQYARLTRRPELFIRLADFDPAVDLLTESILREGRSPDLYLQRAYAHYFLEDLLHARSDVDRALALSPAFLPAILLKGAASYALGTYDEAWKMIERVDSLRPGWSIAHLNRAVLLREEGRVEEALDQANRAVETCLGERGPLSSPTLVHLVRSLVRFETGDLNGAEADWAEARRVNPRESLAFTPDRARIFSRNWLWAQAYFAWCERQGADRTLLLVSRGETALRAGQFEQAVADFTEVLKLRPALRDLCYYRGVALQGLSRPGEAATEFNQAIKVTSRRHIRRMAAARLKQLESSFQS